MSLKEYLEAYMKRHDLTIRAFARLSGVNHEGIRSIISKPDYKPDVLTLDKIAEYTGVSVVTLLKMVYPDVFDENHLTAQSEIVAQAFDEAPESVQDLVLRLIGLK